MGVIVWIIFLPFAMKSQLNNFLLDIMGYLCLQEGYNFNKVFLHATSQSLTMKLPFLIFLISNSINRTYVYTL